MKTGTFLKGKTYWVTQEGCSLVQLVSTGVCSWTYRKKHLWIGDVIEYRGIEPGWGSDNVSRDVFSKNGFKGWFEPFSIYGIDAGLLEETDKRK